MTANADSIPGLRASIRSAWLTDETTLVRTLAEMADLTPEATSRVTRFSQKLIMLSRERFFEQGGVDAFLQEYNLSSQEGVVLMCLAEALLRIPDSNVANKLIQEKLSNADWSTHIGASHSVFVNASSWGLMLTGQIIRVDPESHNIKSFFKKLISRSGEAVIRLALKEAMQIMARQFVLGNNINQAIHRAGSSGAPDYLYSFDMLGEAAQNQADADRYYQAYATAINEIKLHYPLADESLSIPIERPGISVKLSALHPRLEMSQRQRILDELVPKMIRLCELAQDADIGLTIDAEESWRLELQLDVFEALFTHNKFRNWSGIGLAVQAYQKRCLPVLKWLRALAESYRKMVMLRLVKGAYWDSEIKHAQENGVPSYPVFSRKVSTDISYLACANYISKHMDHLYPQFATHNAYTIAAVTEIVANKGLFEFQRLHGMGNAIFDALNEHNETALPTRIYAPVGSHDSLLPYLVRRLLENGANTSFLNRFAHHDTDIDSLIQPPVELLQKLDTVPHPQIPLPPQMYAPDRTNSPGLNLDDPDVIDMLNDSLSVSRAMDVFSLVNGKKNGSNKTELFNPAQPEECIGRVSTIDGDAIPLCYKSAVTAYKNWQWSSAEQRAAILDKLSELIEENHATLLWLIVKEGGRCIRDALSEIREAIDYCRYYAHQARQLFTNYSILKSPTGELDQLGWHGRGVFVCISPWNFPLAIFLGQIAAALAAGNSVIAKPASQSVMTGYFTVTLFHKAGVPTDVLQLLIGDASHIGKALLSQSQLGGVAFTGSTETARTLQFLLSQRPGPMVPLIAETGGQNAMIVDSSALIEQVVQDAVTSAFNSAGQRCSALRVLFVQREIADRLIDMLSGAMDELKTGDPASIDTDIGPLISKQALSKVNHHIDIMRQTARDLHSNKCQVLPQNGYFLHPQVFELHTIDQLTHEVFGPVLHVIRFDINKLDQVVDSINGTGYGLTLGIHSRIETIIQQILRRAQVGNVYINRNMIGAQVGVQPFGGEGLSGTGPKAGGPNYLQRFATERSISNNTAAIGGNTGLMSLGD